jgi:hypothetical protein
MISKEKWDKIKMPAEIRPMGVLRTMMPGIWLREPPIAKAMGFSARIPRNALPPTASNASQTVSKNLFKYLEGDIAMRRLMAFGLVALALWSNALAAHALGGTYGKGDPKHPVSNSTWPDGVTPLANLDTRVEGRWINGSDWFDYRGNSKALNAFLKGYAKVEGATLILTTNGGALANFGLASGYDWEMFAGYGSVSVQLPLNGHFRLSDLHVPVEISIACDGNPTGEVVRFLARHEQQRRKAGLLPASR